MVHDDILVIDDSRVEAVLNDLRVPIDMRPYLHNMLLLTFAATAVTKSMKNQKTNFKSIIQDLLTKILSYHRSTSGVLAPLIVLARIASGELRTDTMDVEDKAAIIAVMTSTILQDAITAQDWEDLKALFLKAYETILTSGDRVNYH